MRELESKSEFIKPIAQPQSQKLPKDQQDLRTHRIVDEIEKIEIESYLNQGENPLIED